MSAEFSYKGLKSGAHQNRVLVSTNIVGEHFLGTSFLVSTVLTKLRSILSNPSQVGVKLLFLSRSKRFLSRVVSEDKLLKSLIITLYLIYFDLNDLKYIVIIIFR